MIPSEKAILETLVSLPSITSEDAGCQSYMMDLLSSWGFECMPMDNPPVSNFFARLGQGSPLLIFAGHTDVVPVGDESKWLTDPFVLHENSGILYGRGVADMKGSLASMLVMAYRFKQNCPEFKGSLGFLITSGEEGDLFDLGTPYVMEKLKNLGIHPDYCIVGEPSSSKILGDVIKIGRRGSLSARITLQGKQGHVAYPHLAENPIHRIAPALAELATTAWDEGNAFFPPTTMQVTHIFSGGKAGNIIPGELILDLNFRFSTELDAETIQKKTLICFQQHQLNPEIEWRLNGQPFLTATGKLLEAVQTSIKAISGIDPELSTSGGTSDGRFIAPFGVEVIELGPENATIHQVNECVPLESLKKLSDLYLEIAKKILTSSQTIIIGKLSSIP